MTEFTLNGTKFEKSETGYCYNYLNGKKVRISATKFEQAFDEYTKAEAQKNTKKKPRRSKDVAWEGRFVTLTGKQVDFIKHIPDTCFYEKGLESEVWCDILADEIGGQFAGKPMTTGAMISTLREKGVIEVIESKMNGKKCKYMRFTEMGKELACELGLN